MCVHYSTAQCDTMPRQNRRRSGIPPVAMWSGLCIVAIVVVCIALIVMDVPGPLKAVAGIFTGLVVLGLLGYGVYLCTNSTPESKSRFRSKKRKRSIQPTVSVKVDMKDWCALCGRRLGELCAMHPRKQASTTLVVLTTTRLLCSLTLVHVCDSLPSCQHRHLPLA